MKPFLAIGLCALLLSVQGCDKIRGFIAEKTGKTETSRHSKGSGILTESEYDAFVTQRGPVVVVNFGAEWCGPCRQLTPVLERVASEFGENVQLAKVDVDKARDLAMRLNVRMLPDVRVFRNGRMVHSFNGFQPEGVIRNELKRLVGENPPDAGKSTNAEQSENSIIRRLIPGKGAEETPEPEPEEPGPPIRPMDKDWLPPGIERR